MRLIGQYVKTVRDPALYTFVVSPKEAGFQGSALFAYKVKWQTLVYVGCGDERDYFDGTQDLEPASRQRFLEVSYAWQH